MTTRKLEASEWQSYMDGITRQLPGIRAEIHVSGLDLGDQVETERLRLDGITYDARDGSLEIASESLHHVISQPREIYVQEEAGALQSIEVVDADGHKQIVQLHRPLALPS
ncbi:MAG: DUF5335 family protein [Myxococcota bacterium]